MNTSHVRILLFYTKSSIKTKNESGDLGVYIELILCKLNWATVSARLRNNQNVS